jgi:hypothetical protein
MLHTRAHTHTPRKYQRKNDVALCQENTRGKIVLSSLFKKETKEAAQKVVPQT